MRTHYKEKSKKNRLDLTLVGRYEIHSEALATKDEWLKAKYPEAEILEPYSPQETKLPVYQKGRINYWQIIINALNPKQYLP